MSSLIPKTCFEDLPDEILLLTCRYLSPVHVLDSLLNLNNRLNQTITLYREKIFLSHLSYKDFYHLIDDHLPYLAANVNYLYINNCSMVNVGKIFEERFSKIDQEFPSLTELIFHQIDIETLENLSWRFNTMKCLRKLNIDIADNRLLSMPIQFDEFLCGKLFSRSNLFESLKLNLNKYQFNLHSITQQCTNIRYLTISVKRLNDLLIIFNYFPHIEQLNITIGCSLPYEKINDTYPYEYLWWKVPDLTKLDLKIQEKDLTSHDNVLSNEIILKIIQNLYSLLYFKFIFDIKFSSALQLTTTKEVYINKYFPYIDGSLWQHALERNDNRNIRFELYVELDGLATNQLKRMMDPDAFLVDKNDGRFNRFQFSKVHRRENLKLFYLDIDFKSILKTTYSSAYWLQKNIAIQCFSAPSNHVSIYTLPITNSHRLTTIDIIDKEISVKSSPSHRNIHNLVILSNTNYPSPKLSLTNLFTKYPCLTNLKIDTILLLPPTTTICSNRLHSLSLYNYSFVSCSKLLDYLPQVTSLSITNSFCTDSDFCPKPFRSITRLKLTIDSFLLNNISNINQYFPNLNEFYLIIKNSTGRSFDYFHQHEKFECLSQGFSHLRYFEITLPIKQDSSSNTNSINTSNSRQTIHTKTSDGHHSISKIWL
jgi:hypothetical protein